MLGRVSRAGIITVSNTIVVGVNISNATAAVTRRLLVRIIITVFLAVSKAITVIIIISDTTTTDT